ncbi:hypothetical protein [Roseovarius sp. ZX-A-9]|uniref:hypothetical protein n=1 Tax=Roseovarius sp. ZX-A-9 TaxID=3014783 RepID=UPI00232BBA9E|nr:hypothetical protein [Roseovarius sp. ZX-A-9]
MTAATVHFLHAIDTEGPLYESLQASFERLDELFGITNLPRTRETLRQLQEGEINLGGKEDEIRQLLRGHRINYMDNWPKVDAMLDRVMDPGFRMSRPDSFGQGWVYNWFCLDHVEFKVNPRRRAMGYHAIHDHYLQRTSEQPDCRDEIQWHFHPMSTYREAHRCATSFVNSPHLHETLARRIIERGFFPSVYRAGFQTERPDSNFFLEQWIPFDISNTALDPRQAWTDSIDLRNGRSGDWRRARHDWTPYHPHHDNYQLEGACRRWIGRALNLMNRFANLEYFEIEKAFAQAAEGRPALVGMASHDFRDLGPEVEEVRDMIDRARKAYPDVPYRFCGANEAFQRTLDLPVETTPQLDLSLELDSNPTDDVPNLTVRTLAGQVFGPQPFLAIETRGQRFIHDNLDFDTKDGTWFYAFHSDTLPFDDVRRIGVGANDAFGRSSVKVIEIVP